MALTPKREVSWVRQSS